MSENERIELLEKEVAELKEQLGSKRLVNNWAALRDNITNRLYDAFETKKMTPQIYQCQSAISCLVGKSFCKNNVTTLSKSEAEEAEIFVSYILNFLTETRKKNTLQDPVRGYERKAL
jgi:hypothetical protein